jgi:hypothetical protein
VGGTPHPDQYGSSTIGGALGSEPRGCRIVPYLPCQIRRRGRMSRLAAATRAMQVRFLPSSPCPRSSADQSGRLLPGGSGVRIFPRAPSRRSSTGQSRSFLNCRVGVLADIDRANGWIHVESVLPYSKTNNRPSYTIDKRHSEEAVLEMQRIFNRIWDDPTTVRK